MQLISILFSLLLISFFFQLPTSTLEWKLIADDYKNMWQFENCLGSIDGKHVAIKKPPGSGSYYYNYKGFHSVVLLALVNAKYEFIYINTGSNGRVSDGGILQETDFYNALVNKTLNLPPPKKLAGVDVALPYVFIGDAAFPLKENLMKPYPQKQITHHEKIFNYRLSRARRVVENSFGILTSRFGVFQRCFSINLKNVDEIILACCVLHNFLLKHSKNYLQPSNLDFENVENGVVIEGDWRNDMNQLLGLQYLRGKQQTLLRDKGIRDLYKNYYNSNHGSIDFQETMINRR